MCEGVERWLWNVRGLDCCGPLMRMMEACFVGLGHELESCISKPELELKWGNELCDSE